MFRPKWLQPLLLLAVSSCASGKAANEFCLIASPIRPGAADAAAISDDLVRQILAHDETGARLCGWRAGTGTGSGG